MKKIFYFFVIGLSILSISCNKELNQIPISQATTLTFYQSPSDFVQAVNAAYCGLRGYPNRLLNLSEMRSDNIYGVSDLGVRDWDAVNDFQKAGLVSNPYVTSAWNDNFNTIFRCNTVLEQITKNGSLINSATLQARLQAEAQFIRAFSYFDLVKYFGKVPLIDHTVGPLEVNTIKQSAVADVYKLIIADLQAAITVLPASYTGVDVGRATKYAAEGLLAQVYMARSGPTYAIDGPGLGLSEWNLALPLIQDIISSGLFTFTPVFSDVFSYTKQNPTVNKEAVFDIMYLTGTNGYGASFPVVLISNDYFKTLGDTKSNGNLENIPVSYDLIGKYAVADKRLLFTIHTAPYTSVAGSIVSNKPFFQKYVDFTKLASLLNSSDWGINFIAIRYTDILMMKAECILNGAPGVQADVDAIVNQVRTRAGVPAMTNVTLAQLFDERRREFACEGSRWFDLQRSGNLLTIMNAWIPVEDAIRKLMNPVVAGFIVYPVPQGQLDSTPGLYTQGTAYQ